MSTLIEAVDLKQHYPVRQGLLGRQTAAVKAVDGVNLRIHRGEVLGLVGESGSGKSTLGRNLMMMERPTSGAVLYEGSDLAGRSHKALHPYRRKMQMVFQDPFSSLNPRMTVEDSLTMPLRFHQPELSAAQRRDAAAETLERVGLPRSMITRYPHEFSGGQRQRIGIARGLIVRPEFMVADEPVSALDVSVQAQVVNLMMELQAELGLSYLFISHDMAVVERVSHNVGVMYLGRIVEIGPRAAVFENPQHPYTQALMKAVPVADPHRRKSEKDLNFKPIPSPIHPVGYEPEPNAYEEVSPGHFVLTSDSGY